MRYRGWLVLAMLALVGALLVVSVLLQVWLFQVLDTNNAATSPTLKKTTTTTTTAAAITTANAAVAAAAAAKDRMLATASLATTYGDGGDDGQRVGEVAQAQLLILEAGADPENGNGGDNDNDNGNEADEERDAGPKTLTRRKTTMPTTMVTTATNRDWETTNTYTDAGSFPLDEIQKIIPWKCDRSISNALPEGFTLDAYNRTIFRERLAPSFIVIGGQKCGTTSLFEYLIQHPQIVEISPEDTKSRALGSKEIRFFDSKYSRGLDFYLSFFATESLVQKSDKFLITGEATPNYIYAPEVAARIYESLPHVKIIAMLRDPVKRSLSHFHHAMLSGRKGNITFEELVKVEMKALTYCRKNVTDVLPEERTVFDDTNAYSAFLSCMKTYLPMFANENRSIRTNVEGYARAIEHRKQLLKDLENVPEFTEEHKKKLPGLPDKRRLSWLQQLLSRGLYAGQLRQYTKYFPPEQLLIINSELFFRDTNSYMNRIAKFLGVEQMDWSDIVNVKHNFGRKNKIEVDAADTARYEPMKASTQKMLEDFFEDWNRDLARSFGSDYYWKRQKQKA